MTTMGLRILVVALVVVAGGAVGYYFCLAAAPDVPTPDFIAAAMKNQEIACGPSLEIKYTSQGETLANGETKSRPLRFVNSYIRTPDVIILEVRTERAKEPTGWEWNYTNKYWFSRSSGQARELVSVPPGVVTAGSIRNDPPPEFLMGVDNMDTVLRYVGSCLLYDAVKTGAVAEQTEEIDGSKCWRIDIPGLASSQVSYRVWVDPEIGFCPRRIDYLFGDNLDVRLEQRGYVNIGNGVWFPMEQITTSYRHPDKTTRTICKVDEYHVGRSLPPEQLTLTFPKGTTVFMGEQAIPMTIP